MPTKNSAPVPVGFPKAGSDASIPKMDRKIAISTNISNTSTNGFINPRRFNPIYTKNMTPKTIPFTVGFAYVNKEIVIVIQKRL